MTMLDELDQRLYAADDAVKAAKLRPTSPGHECRDARSIRCSECGRALDEAFESRDAAEFAVLTAVRAARPR